VLRPVVRSVTRLGAAAQNALEIARFGGLNTDAVTSPYEVVGDVGIARLRRYFGDFAEVPADAPVVVLVPPLMLTAEVWDVSPTTSAVAALAASGISPWVIDFGSPEDVEGGRDRTLADHVVAVSDAIDAIRESTGRDVHLAGYSQGGMFAYQAAALRRSAGLASVIAFGSPVDVHRRVPFGLPEEPVTQAVATLARTLFSGSAVPGWMTRTGFKLLDPVKTVRSRIDFFLQLHDRELLLQREPQRRFLDGGGFIAWPGPALAEFAQQFVAHNRMLSGGFVIDGRLVTLADVTCPVLTFVGLVDEIAPPATVRAIARAAPRAEVHECALTAGHFGLVVGSQATTRTWPTVAAWIHWREALTRAEGRRQAPAPPDGVVPLPTDQAPAPDHDPELHVSHGLQLAAGVGAGVARSVARAVGRGGRTVRAVADEAVELLPRLVRFERVKSDTPISLGLLLDEQAAAAPDAGFFLFQGRGHSYGDAKHRIDSIVRGLVSVGVRQGEHVGVLMGTRPTALALVAALSRLGAVAVLLRPDGALERELELGQVRRVVTDPEHAASAVAVADVPVYVLGGVGAEGSRDLPAGITDMEQIDPAAVALPGWYRPNPGRAEDLAFVLFTGHGDRTRVNRITNRRWSLSAVGTAAAARLSRSDTVYSVTPIHHPSGLLVAIGGAVAGGARLALTRTFDPDTFWDEVRRFGATVVAYTWTLCRALVEAPPSPAERHHPVRLFVGSGMPSGVWRRVLDRFAPAGVLEFYAATEGEAVLGNVAGGKIGAKGRPIPGSAPVAVARYDLTAGRLVEGSDGFAQRCGPDEVGMLLARVDRSRGVVAGSPLRGVFAPGDAWVATGDLFRVDEDGDYWLADHLSAVVHTAAGPVPTVPVEDAFGRCAAIDLPVVYGIRPAAGAPEVLVMAVQVRQGHDLGAEDLTAVARDLAPTARPDLVHVVDGIPLTTWFRPRKVPLRVAGLDGIVLDRPAWRWDATAEGYVPLVAADLGRLA
jgi:putative long chain acyl-CoA synthase